MNLNKQKILIHASNVAGLGSMNVVSNLLTSDTFIEYYKTNDIQIILPDTIFWKNKTKNITIANIYFVKRFKVQVLRFIYRAFELLLSGYFLPKCDKLIVLGDFPMRFKGKQILLLHNPHILDSFKKINIFSFHRILFLLNHKFVTTCIVQSEIVKDKLIRSYPFFKNKCHVLIMPVSEIYNNVDQQLDKTIETFKLFYPGSFYKHKNHQIISNFLNICYANLLNNIHINLTITKFDFETLKNVNHKKLKYLTFLGILNENEVLNYYQDCHALLFPSLDETLGLPLIEAMKMNKFIICSDKPFSRWLCGNEAIYFDAINPKSLQSAIELAKDRYIKNIHPNWADALNKVPKNWNVFGQQFLEVI